MKQFISGFELTLQGTDGAVFLPAELFSIAEIKITLKYLKVTLKYLKITFKY